jgi:hypothetical protein
MTGARNHWITFVGHTVVGWQAVLPPPRGDATGAVRFGAALVDAGKRHAVWDTQAFASGAAFAEHVRVAATERGRIPMQLRGVTGDAATMARLAVYRDDQIVEEDVADVGALLASLRSGRPSSTTRGTPAVVVLGPSIALDHAGELRIEIRLDTDIWFPSVMGFDEPIPDDGDPPDSYDNRALAERHTPRLNAFLGEVAREVTTLGGRWEVLDVGGIARNYRDQWDEHGIRL